MAGAGGRGRHGDGGAEALRIGDVVVGGQHQHQRVGVAVGQEAGGDGDGRRGVAGRGLEDDGVGGDADLAHLLGDDEAVVVGAIEHRRGEAVGLADPVTVSWILVLSDTSGRNCLG